MDEHKAVHLLKLNDLSGLAWLVEQYYQRAFQTACLITGDQDLAEDAVQETFVSLPQTIHGFDDARPFAPWFFKCVSNAAVKAASRDSRQIWLDHLPGENELEEILARENPTLDEQVERAEIRTRLAALMQQLNPRQRAVLVQRYYLEMSEKEMAERQGVALGTLKWLLSEARGKMRLLLKQERKEL